MTVLTTLEANSSIIGLIELNGKWKFLFPAGKIIYHWLEIWNLVYLSQLRIKLNYV